MPKKSFKEQKVSFKSGRSKALGGKKESLKAAASSKEAGLQRIYGAEKGKRQWWRGWIVSRRWQKKVFNRVFKCVFF